MREIQGGQALAALRTLFDVGAVGDLTDGQLLERFLNRPGEGAELAFAALVERHGPMVLRVCRGLLRDGHEAEDSFQATFLVLARSARSIRRRDSVGGWLHGVARRVAWRARLAASRRRAAERRAAAARPGIGDAPSFDDSAAAIHEEIAHLPERYRTAVVLCDLSGLTEGQAAALLGCPLGTIRSRLARARDRLRARLALRGVVPTAGLLGAASLADAASAALVTSTARAAVALAGGNPAMAGIVPPSPLAIAEDFTRTLLMTTTARIAAAALALALAMAGAAALGRPASARPQSADEDARRTLIEHQRTLGDALVRRDVAAADRIFAYEMIGTDPGGGTWTKTEYLDRIGTDGFGVKACDLVDCQVRVFGDAAVVIGRNRVVAEAGGTTSRYETRSTNTYIRRGGAWQCAAWQTAVLPAPAPAPRRPARPAAPGTFDRP